MNDSLLVLESLLGVAAIGAVLVIAAVSVRAFTVWRMERRFLTGMARIWGVVPRRSESNQSIRMRIEMIARGCPTTYVAAERIEAGELVVLDSTGAVRPARSSPASQTMT